MEAILAQRNLSNNQYLFRINGIVGPVAFAAESRTAYTRAQPSIRRDYTRQNIANAEVAMPSSPLCRVFAILAAALPCAAQAQEDMTIVTRSSGTMEASGIAQDFLGLPSGLLPYELVVNSSFRKSGMVGDAQSFYAESVGAVTLTVNGVSQTFRDLDGWSQTTGDYGSQVPYGGTTDYFQHGIFTGTYYGIGLSGCQRVNWLAGTFPGVRDLSSQSWSFDGAGSGEVFFKLAMGGELLDGFEGTADHVEMTISSVPEPGPAPLLVAGLGVPGLLARRRYAASAGCSAFSISARVKPWAKRSMKS